MLNLNIQLIHPNIFFFFNRSTIPSITIYLTTDEREEGVLSQLFSITMQFYLYRRWQFYISYVIMRLIKFAGRRMDKFWNFSKEKKSKYFAINVSTRCDFDHLGINGSLWNAYYINFSQNWSIIHLFFSLKLYHIPLVLQVPT